MSAHARLSPSSSSRWLLCPASVRLSEGLPDEPKIWSAEGSVAHDIFERCLLTGQDVVEFIGKEYTYGGFRFKITEEWDNALQPGLDLVRDIVEEHDGIMHVEHRVKLDKIGENIDLMPGQFGTLDVGIITKKEIVLFDLKYGAGVPVDAHKNTQLMIYALGFWYYVARHHTRATKFRLIIYQPRARGGGGEYEITLDELLQFAKKVQRRAAETYSDKAAIVPGEKQCTFCPAFMHNKCDTVAEYLLEFAGTNLDHLDFIENIGADLKLKKVSKLTLEARSNIVKNASLFRKWLDHVHNNTMADAMQGRPTPGLKVITGRQGNRYWKDEKAAAKKLERRLGDKAYEITLKSPTDVEKLHPKVYREVEDLTERSPGKPSLVPLERKGEAITPTIALFDNLDEED